MTVHKRAKEALIEEITDEIIAARDLASLYDIKDKWGGYATAIAAHRLANAWERRVEIAKATAKQKGINL